jgi:hypothetical protein
MTNMKRYLLRMIVAFITFIAGVTAAGFWLTHNAPAIQNSTVITSPQTNNSNQSLSMTRSGLINTRATISAWHEAKN